MADVGVFDTGYQQGFERGSEARERKKALSDADIQQHVNDLLGEREALKKKLPTLLDEQGKKTPEYDNTMDLLQKNFGKLREIYHPDNNPGAISKFGHMLTDHLGITNPQEREKKHDEKVSSQEAGDKGNAEDFAATADPSPEQAAALDSRTRMAQLRAQIDDGMKAFDQANPNADPDARQKFQNQLVERTVLGMTPRDLSASERGKWSEVPGHLKSGEPLSLLFDAASGIYKTKSGETVGPEVLDNWSADPKQPKPSTSWSNEWAGSYARMHGLTMADLTPADFAYIQQQIKLNSMPTSTSITNTLKQDIYGRWVPIQETNRRIPGFGEILKDPRGEPTNKVVLPKPPTEDSQAPGGTPAPTTAGARTLPTPQGLRREVNKVSPKHAGSSSPNASVRVGEPVMQGRTAEYTKAKTDYDQAVKADALAKLAQESHEAVQQRSLALALIKALANRVQMTEYQLYTQQMGVENTVEGMIKGIEDGQLPDGIVQQLVDLAHNNLTSAKAELDAATPQPLNSPEGAAAPPPSGVKPPTAKFKKEFPPGSNQWYWLDAQGNNLGKVAQ